MKHLNFLCCISVALAAISCDKAEFDSTDNKVVSLDRTNIVFTYKSDEQTSVSVTTKEEIRYDVSYADETDKDWLEVSAVPGKDSETLLNVKTLSANESEQNRNATINIVVKDVKQTVQVTQEFFDPMIYLVDRNVVLEETEGASAEVSFDVEADWTAELRYENEADWLTLSQESGKAGDNQKIVLTTISANSSQIERKATLLIKYWTKECEVKIVQNVGERVMTPDKTEVELGQASGQSVKLTFDITKDWTTEIEYQNGVEPWIALSAQSGVQGNGQSVDITSTGANRGKEDRVATVKFIYEGGYYPVTVIQKCVQGNMASDFDSDFLKVLVDRKLLPSEDIVTQEQLNAIKKIEISATESAKGSLKSLRGIEFMPSLQVLKCDYHELESLDVSHNAALVELYVSGNGMTELNVTNTPKLVRLYAQYNMIASIDLTDKPVLRMLMLGENNLASLDITGCSPSALLGFTCAMNPGKDGEFRIKAWFDNSSIPANYTNSDWTDKDGNPIRIIYEKVTE